MKTLIFQCKSCQIYTISRLCPQCSESTSNPLPPRFSPQDKYGKYRRMLKED
ncbi:MAG: RNA-protein complex protein Nop10 [Candidatus Thermoplasmatota archaeon]|nr:RNA-protein complex protein Nop10 [Candidatus Thermoplasmatota archaeon]